MGYGQWSITHQVPLSMGFSRQQYWSGLPCPPPEDLPDPGIKPTSLMSPALVGELVTPRATREVHFILCGNSICYTIIYSLHPIHVPSYSPKINTHVDSSPTSKKKGLWTSSPVKNKSLILAIIQSIVLDTSDFTYQYCFNLNISNY